MVAQRTFTRNVGYDEERQRTHNGRARVAKLVPPSHAAHARGRDILRCVLPAGALPARKSRQLGTASWGEDAICTFTYIYVQTVRRL